MLLPTDTVAGISARISIIDKSTLSGILIFCSVSCYPGHAVYYCQGKPKAAGSLRRCYKAISDLPSINHSGPCLQIFTGFCCVSKKFFHVLFAELTFLNSFILSLRSVYWADVLHIQ